MDEQLAAGSGPAPVWVAVGIAITAAVNLWRGRRADRLEQQRTSGSIETSDAETVWAQRGAVFEEAERIRHELRDEVERLRGELSEARGRIATLEASNDELRTRLEALERKSR